MGPPSFDNVLLIVSIRLKARRFIHIIQNVACFFFVLLKLNLLYKQRKTELTCAEIDQHCIASVGR